jgi:DNA polymerase-3 subunit delta'
LIAEGQQRVDRVVRDFLREGTLPHSLLLTGPEGTGKALFAVDIAARLNCEAEEDRPDGICPACGKVRRLEHPDLHLVFPVPSGEWEKSMPAVIESRREDFYASGEFGGRARSIGIGSIRKVIETVSKHPFEGRRTVVIIFDAHMMTVEAQNAFLKVLEEPPPSSVLLLVTEFGDKLLDTVLSRCQHIRFDYLGREAVGSFLETFYSVERNEAERISILSEGNLRRGIRFLEEGFVRLRADAASMLGLAFAGTGRDLLGESERIAREYNRDEVRTLIEEMAVLVRILMRQQARVASKEEKALLEEMIGPKMAAEGEKRDLPTDLGKIDGASNSLSKSADLELTLSHLLLDLAGKWY